MASRPERTSAGGAGGAATRRASGSVPRRVIHGAATVMELLAALGIVALMMLTLVHVTMRLFGGRGIAGGIEIVEVVLAAVVFLGLAYAQRIDAHVSTSILTDRLPVRVSAVVQIVALAAAVLFFAWMTYETAKRGLSSWQRGETRVGLRAIPIWPARLIIPVGLAALVLELLLTVADRVADLRHRVDAA